MLELITMDFCKLSQIFVDSFTRLGEINDSYFMSPTLSYGSLLQNFSDNIIVLYSIIFIVSSLSLCHARQILCLSRFTLNTTVPPLPLGRREDNNNNDVFIT